MKAEEIPAAALPLVVAAPAVDLTRASHGYRVMLAASQHQNLVLCRGEHFDKGRHGSVLLVADAQLPMIVQAPGIDLMLRIDVEGVMVARKDIDGVTRAHSLYQKGLLVLVAGVQETTKLA